MKRLLVTVLLIACIPNPSHSQKETVVISAGFMSGKEYLDLSDAQKRAYAMGVINGMLTAPLFGLPEEKVQWLWSCAENMTDQQVAAILTKYVQDNPGQWHYRMNALSYSAMQKTCPKGQ